MEDVDTTHEDITSSNQEVLVCAEFTDAYSFRCLIEYLNLTNDSGNFIFTPAGISFSKQNDSSQVLNNLYIFSHELTNYLYYSDEEKIMVGINIGQFNSTTKQIGKKDVAKLTVTPLGICLQVVKSPKSGSDKDADFIRSQRLEYNQYSMDGYQREEEPNFTTSIQCFTCACSQEASSKDDFITIQGYDSGIVMRATQGGNIKTGVRYLGDVDETTVINGVDKISKIGEKTIRVVVKAKGELVNHKIPRKIIGALGKLNNISPNGTVKFYLQPNMPIKLIFHISTYGILHVYLRGK